MTCLLEEKTGDFAQLEGFHRIDRRSQSRLLLQISRKLSQERVCLRLHLLHGGIRGNARFWVVVSREVRQLNEGTPG